MAKKLIAGIMIILLLLASCINGPTETPTSTPAGDPPATGDWIVTGQRVIEDETITLSGNLLIKSGGILTLRNVKLLVNSSYDGQYTISVELGGSMFIYGSNITAVDLEHRFAFIANGSAFEMKDSELHCAGWSWGNRDDNEAKGLLLKTPGAVLEDNVISGNFIGAVLLGDGAMIKGNSFHSNDYEALEIFSSHNTIINNSFQHATNFDSIIINMGRAHNNIITNNTITQKSLLQWPNMGAIAAWASWNNLIADNTIDADWAVGMISGSSNNLIQNNTFESRELSVFIHGGTNNRIEGNDMRLVGDGVRLGVVLTYAHHNVVAGNNIVGVPPEGKHSLGNHGVIYLDHSNGNHILNNQISGSTDRSIFLTTSKNNAISGNGVSGSQVGLFLYYLSDNNKMSGNTISSERASIIVDNCTGNLIHHNTFSDHAGQNYASGDNQWDYEGAGNYWNHYEGKDIDSDGVGDTPYPLPLEGVDRYPLIKSVVITSVAVPETKPVSFADGPQRLDATHTYVVEEKVIENQILTIEAGTIAVQPTGSLTIRNSTLILGGKGPIDIEVSGGGLLHIEQSVIKAADDGYGFQIAISDDSSLVMKDSELHGASWNHGNGLCVVRAKSAVIENNIITGSYNGVYLGRVGTARIVNNVFRGNGQAISLDTTSNAVVEGNTVYGAVWMAIGVMGWDEVHGVEVRDNTVLSSWGEGIQVPSNTNVEYNTVSNCKGAGISVTGSGLTIQGNTVSHCGMGIAMKGSANLIYRNNLCENDTQAEDGERNNQWDNGHQGNYWSDYTGKDANGDDIGDTRYPVPPNGVDNYPLMKPYEGSPK